MKPFTSKHCTQYLTKSSPFNQREELKSLAEKEYEQDLRREKRMPGFAEKPEGGIQRVANKNKLEAKRKISQPAAKKPSSKLKEQYRPKTGPTGIAPDKRQYKPTNYALKKGSEADEATLKRMSSTKYKK